MLKWVKFITFEKVVVTHKVAIYLQNREIIYWYRL
jgi:hypothetical protein